MHRPSFSLAWAASHRIYDPSKPSEEAPEKVAEVIGGHVEMNIENPNENARWTNTCAVRMSYILNECGIHIPYIKGETVSGADKRYYFFRVKNLISFLELTWGPPEIVEYPPSGGGPLASKKGLILFEVQGWGDAQGHATLFDGTACYDHCYFNDPGVAYHTKRANFWILPN